MWTTLLRSSRNHAIQLRSRLSVTRALSQHQQQEQKQQQQQQHDEEEIYRGILSAQIRLVKSFSLMTSGIGLACQPVLFMQAQTGQNIGLVLGAGAFVSFFTFVTPLLIHSFSKKYVTKLYYNQSEDSYTAVTYSLLLRPKKTKFKLEDVNVPDIPGMFTTFKANNVPLFVDGKSFNQLHHYGKIMGYDKPLDLRWPKQEDDSNKP